MAKAEIDLNEDGVYIVQGGKKTKLSPIQYGQDTIVWQRGKVLDVDRSERIRLEGQGVI